MKKFILIYYLLCNYTKYKYKYYKYTNIQNFETKLLTIKYKLRIIIKNY